MGVCCSHRLRCEAELFSLRPRPNPLPEGEGTGHFALPKGDGATMESEAELIFQQADRALQDAADRVVEEARRTNGEVVVWENGAVRHIPADQLPPTKLPSP